MSEKVSAMPMRILTVRQPWAWAIISGGKSVENRARNLAGDYRGPVAIHTALKRDDQGWIDLGGWRLTTGMRDEPLTLGQIIGVVDLVDVHAGWIEGHPCSPWGERYIKHAGQWHLVLANPRPLSEPIPYKGALGLRTVPAELQARIEAAL